MYPNNQDIEIFGEQVKWPGVDQNGKFTNGSFEDPMIKPSFIPAETINLILDNLSEMIKKMGGVPNATGITQIADLMTHLAVADHAVLRDENGRAKIAPLPDGEEADADDIARLGDIASAVGQMREDLEEAGIVGGGGDNLAEMVEGYGRNLLEVLGVETIAEAMAEIHRRCNNSGEIDATGIPDFRGICIGDYVDGIDLSAIPAENGGTAGQAWNDTYKNNRILVSGFNTYKNMGDTENSKNHILFTFRHIPIKKRVNSGNDNTGGYTASELRAFLEGTAGNGTGDKSSVTTAAFMNALKAQTGDYLYTIRKAHSTKSGSSWASYTVFPPSEIEVFGVPTYGDEGVYMAAITSPSIAARAGWITPIHIPLYQKAFVYRIKSYNGSRDWWWEQTHYAAAASSFCFVDNYGNSSNSNAGSVGGCAPAFCVA
jgi:hypothetical protein